MKSLFTGLLFMAMSSASWAKTSIVTIQIHNGSFDYSRPGEIRLDLSQRELEAANSRTSPPTRPFVAEVSNRDKNAFQYSVLGDLQNGPFYERVEVRILETREVQSPNCQLEICGHRGRKCQACSGYRNEIFEVLELRYRGLVFKREAQWLTN